jgi:hypothetical protein
VLLWGGLEVEDVGGDVVGAGGGGGKRLANDDCMACMLRLSRSMLRPIWSTTPARDATVRVLSEDSEVSDGAVRSGPLDTAGEATVQVGGSADIVPRLSDTKLVGILALPDDEQRLYECEGGCLGLSERGR